MIKFNPAIFQCDNRPPRRWRDWLGQLLRWLPWLILGIGLVATGLVWLDWRHEQTGILRNEFRIQVGKVRTSIEHRIETNKQILRGVAGLFTVDESINRAQFRAYVESLNLSVRYPGIQGVGFSRLIAPADKDALIEAIRAEGFPDFMLRPPGIRDVYTAIIYLEPFDWRNQRAFGYDMFSEPIRQAAMTRAWESGQTSVSGKVRLVQETETDAQAGFLIYVPVYRPGLHRNTLQERQSNLLGWAYSPLRMGKLMESFLQDYPELVTRIALTIYDGTDMTAETLMFESVAAPRLMAHHFQEIQQIDLSGHTWTLLAQTLPAFDDQARQLSEKDRLILGAGIALSFALSLLAWVLIRSHLRITDALRQTAQAHRALLESQQRLRLIFDTSDVAIFLTDLTGRIIQANARMAEMFRCPLGTLIGSDYVSHIHSVERENAQRQIRKLLTRQTVGIKQEWRYWRKDGSEFWGHLGGHLIRDADGQPIGLVGVIADTTQRRETEEKIEFLAHHDYLTGLPNRVLFVERVGQTLALARRTRGHLGILFLDLDGFKPINDRYGHQAGDLVLCEVAKRLREHTRDSDTVCRQGGDEFVILVPELPARDHLERLARILTGVIGQPYEIGSDLLSLSVSIGMAVYPEHGETVDKLLQSADAAMYLAKGAGHSQVQFA